MEMGCRFFFFLYPNVDCSAESSWSHTGERKARALQPQRFLNVCWGLRASRFLSDHLIHSFSFFLLFLSIIIIIIIIIIVFPLPGPGLGRGRERGRSRASPWRVDRPQPSRTAPTSKATKSVICFSRVSFLKKKKKKILYIALFTRLTISLYYPFVTTMYFA